MSTVYSKLYEPEAHACCPKCCFGQGNHADWCPVGLAMMSLRIEPEPDDLLEKMVGGRRT